MNNFNSNSDNIDLELNVSWDNDLAQMYFDDSFTRVEHDGSSLLEENHNYRDVAVYLYNGGLELGFELSDLENWDLKSGTIKSIKDWIKDNHSEYTEDLNHDSQQYFDKPFYKLDKMELIEFVENANTDYTDFLKDVFTPTFKIYGIRGHCQGDYVEVIIPQKVINNHGEGFLDNIEEHLTNLFYNQPLYARLTIEGLEDDLYLDGFQEDRYTYDKGLIIKHVEKELQHEQKEYIIKWLSDNLPKEPDYI